MGADARQQRGLGQPFSRRAPGDQSDAGRRLRRLRAAHSRADGADAVVPLPRLLVGNCSKLPVLRIDVWSRVPLAAVPAGCAGQRAARRGIATAALDRHAVRIRTIAGALINRIGERSLIVGGLLLQAIGIAWIGLIITPDLAYAKLVTPLVLAGAGVSMAMPAAQNAVLSAVAPAEIGKASGTFNMFRYLGGAFGIAILVAVFARTGGVDSPQAFSAGFAPACGSSPGARRCWRQSVRSRETRW